jgi:hypothetical protein
MRKRGANLEEAAPVKEKPDATLANDKNGSGEDVPAEPVLILRMRRGCRNSIWVSFGNRDQPASGSAHEQQKRGVTVAGRSCSPRGVPLPIRCRMTSPRLKPPA